MAPILAITMGDVNGVGPEILAKALVRDELWRCCRPLVIGSADALRRAQSLAPGGPEPVAVTDFDAASWSGRARVPVLDAGRPAPDVEPGVLNPETGACAVEWLKLAVHLAMLGRIGGLVTCPLNKESIHRAGYHYSGHTEIVAEMTASPDYRMCLFAEGMRIVHITSHLSMRDALDAVRQPRIEKSIRIGEDALQRLGLARRRIAVAGLNPHAGEAGAFGTEERDEIEPAIRVCRAEGIDCSGPYPPDTVFKRMHEGEFDLVVSMYHDQGHTPLKLIAMDQGVNVTLGIPIVRTSVDHGTAYDIAWKGIAREDSLIAAIALASRLSCGGE